MTFFSALIRRLGLSQTEAAFLLEVRLDTIKSWSSGRNGVPAQVWAELRELAERQAETSDRIADLLDGAPEGLAAIETNLPAGDWPGDGAAAVALVDAWLASDLSAPMVIVEPGSTPATAAARAQRLKIN